MVSFGLAPAVLAFTWGLWPLKRLGWAAGFIYVTATAMRLARFNIQTAAVTDKRYFVGMPSPPAAGVIAATVYLYPYGLQDRETAFPALAMVLVPAFLMVSTFRFRSIKAIDVGWRRSYFVLFLAAVGLALIATHPRLALVVLAYLYLASAFIGLAYSRLRSRKPVPPPSRHRQSNSDRRTGALAARDVDRSAARFDVASRNRQAKAGARGLGGEVGLEDPRQRLVVHPDAGIANGESRRCRPPRRR